MAHSTQVELLVGSTWTDLTAAGDVYTEGGVTITRGRSSEGGAIEQGTCTLTLNNAGGKFSPRKPTSPYYGLIGRNTPLRVSVRAGSTFLDIPDNTACRAKVLDAAVLDITGDLDVRADLTPAGWAGSWTNGFYEVMGKWDGGTGNRSWRLNVFESGLITFAWSADGSAFLQAASTQPVPFGPGRRGAIRATIDVNNNIGGYTVTFYYADTISGTWVQLGSPTVTTAGTTSIFSGTAELQVGDITSVGFPNIARRYHAAEVRNGIGGTVVANPIFSAQTIGATSFTDGAGRSWTIEGGASLTNKRIRFVGEVSEWPPRWHASGGDQRVTIQASGILRRLNQGAAPLDSTLRRRIPSEPSILAYWPMEEGSDATQAYSPIKGVRPMAVDGVDWASDDSLAGSSALPTIQDAGTLNGIIPAPAGASTSWHGEFIFKCDAGPATARTILNWYTSGTVRQWRLMLDSGGAQLRGYDVDGTEIVTDLTPLTALGVFGAWARWKLYATQNGGNIDWVTAWVPIGGAGGQKNGSVAGTVGRLTSVASGGWHADLEGVRIGHVSAFSAANILIYNNADIAFTGETAGDRMDRLRTEESLPLAVYGYTPDQVPLGPQRPNALLDTLQAAADADGGVLYEARDVAALRYRDRISQYNQTAALALTYGQPGLAPPFEPVDDDRSVRNDRTVVRDGGSSARATLDTGALSTQAPPNGVGRYDDSVTLSLATDDQCEDQAGWRLWLGTWDEARYPSVHVSLTKAAASGLIDPATAVDIRDKVTISNPPDSLPPDPISLLVEGYTEVITPTTWDITYVCSPAGPWNVGVADDPVLGRADTDGSTLTSAVTSTATSFSVTTPGTPWVSASAVLNANPDFYSNLTGWNGNGGALTRVPVPAPAPTVSAFCAQLVPDGVSSVPNIASSSVAATVGTVYRVSAWVRCTSSRSVDLNVNWFTSGGSYISTSGAQNQTVQADQWTWFEGTVTAPATTGLMTVNPTIGSTPPPSAVLYGQQITIRANATTPALAPQEFPIDVRVGGEVMRVHSITGATSPQTFGNVIRSVNGVVKAQSAGADLRLAQPMILGL